MRDVSGGVACHVGFCGRDRLQFFEGVDTEMKISAREQGMMLCIFAYTESLSSSSLVFLAGLSLVSGEAFALLLGGIFEVESELGIFRLADSYMTREWLMVIPADH